MWRPTGRRRRMPIWPLPRGCCSLRGGLSFSKMREEILATDEHGLTRIQNTRLIGVHPCLSAAQIVFSSALLFAVSSAVALAAEPGWLDRVEPLISPGQKKAYLSLS